MKFISFTFLFFTLSFSIGAIADSSIDQDMKTMMDMNSLLKEIKVDKKQMKNMIDMMLSNETISRVQAEKAKKEIEAMTNSDIQKVTGKALNFLESKENNKEHDQKIKKFKQMRNKILKESSRKPASKKSWKEISNEMNDGDENIPN